METNFKLKKSNLIKIPVRFPLCYGCVFYGLNTKNFPMCMIPSLSDEDRKKIEVMIPTPELIIECPKETKFDCSIIKEDQKEEYIFVYDR